MSISNPVVVELAASDLTVSKLNVRKKQLVQDIQELALDIQEHGQLQPVLVRKEGDQLAVVAGQRRLAAINKLNSDSEGDLKVSAIVVECDDLEAMRLSLSENYFQSAMSDLQFFRVFVQLIKKGSTVADLSRQYSMTTKRVEQVLALGRLPEKVLSAYEQGDINEDSLRYLAICSSAQVARFVKAYKSGDYPSHVYALKNLLNTGQTIEVSTALFDIPDSKLTVITDIFNDDRSFFADSAAFWEHQNAAVGVLKESLEDLGWKVELVDGGYYKWQWGAVTKAEGGKAVIFVDDNGSVEVVKGILSTAVLEKRQKATDQGNIADSDDSAENEKAEVTNKMSDYLKLYALKQARHRLALDFELSQRYLLIGFLCRNSYVSFDRKYDFERYDESVAQGQASDCEMSREVDDFIRSSLEAVGYDLDDTWADKEPVRKAILEAPIEVVQSAIQAITVLSLSHYSMNDGSLLDSDDDALRAVWSPTHDTAFFDVLNGKPLMNAILQEFSENHLSLDSKVSEMREAIRESAQREKTWLPKYFKGGSYLNGKGNPFSKKK